jgi:putative aldouronate transport system substrate-binding protein
MKHIFHWPRAAALAIGAGAGAIALALAGAGAIAIALGGCARQKNAAAAEGPLETGLAAYPLETEVTLSYWVALSNNVSANFSTMRDTPFSKALQERTGVQITWLHPPMGGVDEQFNLLTASGDLPDIMERDWVNKYPGGPEKAIADGVILRLNDLIADYAPHLKAYLASHPDIDRMVKTDQGSYYAFPLVRGDETLGIWHGLIIRKDWLDELGLAIPETYDEWHTVLTAFKDVKKSPAPLTMNITQVGDFLTNDFLLGRGVDRGFFLDGQGRVRWGGIESAYRDYLRMMAAWYREGLIDPDTATITNQQVTAKITNGTSGASRGGLAGQMGSWLNAARATNPSYALAGAPYPTARKGTKSPMINIDNLYTGAFSAAITTNCAHPEIAARFLDYAFSEEGHLLNNFGIEGLSYTLVDGKPMFTGEVTHNPKGWSQSQSQAAYCRSSYGGPFVQDPWVGTQNAELPEQKAARAAWTIPDPYKHKLPTITPSPEESREAAQIMNDVNTYANEMLVKYILGTESLATWDTYVATIKKMKIERAIEIQEAALRRYRERQ